MNEIREAVEKVKHLHTLFAKTRTGRETISDDFYWIEPLVSLAERYLAVEARMPEKKDFCRTHGKTGEYMSCDVHFNRGYSKAIDECTLAATKMMLSREEILDIISNGFNGKEMFTCIEVADALLKAQAEKMKEE